MAALVVLVGLGVMINFLFLSPRTAQRTLSGEQVAASVASTIQSQRHSSSPPDVRCPATIELRAGATFTCTLVEKPHPVLVDVTQIDGRGDFRLAVTNVAPAPLSGG